MTNPFQIKKLQVPGVLDDGALQERLKLFTQQQNATQNAAPPPTSAVDFSRKIQDEYLANPQVPRAPQAVEKLKASPSLTRQNEAIDVRSNILSDAMNKIDNPIIRNLLLGPVVGVLGEGGVLDKMGTLSDEERQAEAEKRAEQAATDQKTIEGMAERRKQLRGMTDEQAQALGLPVAPGGVTPDEIDQLEQQDNRVVTKARTDTAAMQGAVTDRSKQPTKAWWLDAIRSGVKGAAAVPLDAAKGGAVLWELTAGRVANGGDIERSDMRAWLDTAEKTIEKVMPADKARAQDFVTQLAAGGGSMASFMLGGMVAKAIGMPVSQATTILGAAGGGANQVEDAEAHNAVGVQKYLAFLLGAGIGATEAIPIDRMFRTLEASTGGLVSRYLRQTAAGSLTEFVQELGQAVGTDVIAKMVYDETREMDPVQWLKQGAIGALTGGLGAASIQALADAGVSSEPPSETPVPAAQREQIAVAVIDALQPRIDAMEGIADQPGDAPLVAAPTPVEGTNAGTPDAADTIVDPSPEVLAQIVARPADPAAAPAPERAAAERGPQYPIAPRSEWYGEANYEAGGGQLVTMTPDEYLAAVRPLQMDDESRENVDLLKEHILAGKTLDPLKVFNGGKEDGRHRALAAKELGIANVPVIVFGDQVARFAAPVPIGRGESGQVLAVPPDIFAQQSRAVTETPAFKNWFGDSKVVDADGKPLVVYHGSPVADSIKAFDPARVGRDEGFYGKGHYFTADEEIADSYTYDEDTGTSGSVLPVYVSLKKPFMWDATTPEARAATSARLAELGIKRSPDAITGADTDSLSNNDERRKFNAAVRAAGYDGVVVKSVYGEGALKEIVAFEPTQIKSAFNGGNFDPNNPDILAMPGGRMPYKGEQVRPDTGIATPASPTAASTSDASLAKIARNVTNLLNLTARQGRLTFRKSAADVDKDVMGQYSRSQDVVRLKEWNDVETLVHEGAHALYFNAAPPLQKFIKDFESELMRAATELYEGDVNTLPRAVHIAEGFAEFFRIYALNNAYAQRNFSAMTQAFDEMLTRTAPNLKEGLDTIGLQYSAWLQMPSAQMLKNMIVTGRQPVGFEKVMAELKDKGFGTWMHEVARTAVETSINRYAKLDDVVNQTLNIGQQNKGKAIDLLRADDPRAIIRLAANSGARGMVQITDGVMDHQSTTPMTRGLREALLRYHGQAADTNLGAIDPVRQQEFASYLVALRGIDEFRRYAEGKLDRMPLGSKVHLADLQQTVDEMNAKYPNDFAEAAKIVHEYGMGLWTKAYHAGLMSKETYTDGLERKFYAPLQRDMSDKKATLGTGALTNGAKLVKQFRGSNRDIIDPMDILMHKTFALEQIIAKNEVPKALARLADKAGKAGALVERIPATQMFGKALSVKEVARALTKDDTISETDAVDLMTLLEASIENDNVINYYRPDQVSTKGENVVFFWEDGKLSAIQLADGDLGADIVNVVNGLGKENLHFAIDAVAATSTVFRTAITSWPDFLVVNFIRDQMSAFVLTRGYKPFFTGLKGVGDEVRQKGWARQYNAAMGTMGGMNTSSLHNARVARDISSLRKQGYLVKAFTEEKGVLGAIKGLARITELTETGTRLGVFKTTFERAKRDGLNDWQASIEASYVATDMMNFGLNGSRMLAARRTIPFLNAQLQGLYKMLRTLGGDEVRQRKGLRFVLSSYFKSINNLDLSSTEKAALQTGRAAWLKMMSLGLISAALNFLFEDDPDYQEAGEYLRTTGWVIPMGDGRLFYIPKPFELAVVANFVERAFESASGDKEAKNRFLRGLMLNIVPPTSPPAIQTIVELQANKDFFTGQEIVPSYMQALAPELQFNNYTTSFAKQLGETMGWSPMVIDHVMSGFGASAYRDLTGMYNMLDPNRPSQDLTDVPLTRRFVRDARRGSASSQDFWKTASTMNGSLRRAELSYRNYLDSGRTAAANEFLTSLPPDERAYAVLNAHFDADAKRLNPFYRARQMTTIVSGLRRELVSPLGVENTFSKKLPDTIKLSKREKADLDEALSELARREMRNTLVAMKAPGWQGKKMLDTEKTRELIARIEPRIGEELDRRIKKARVYGFNAVNEYWPEVKDRLLSDRENTFLKDIIAIAKVAQ